MVRSAELNLICVGILVSGALTFSSLSFAQVATGKPIEDITNMVKGLGGLLSNLVSPKGQKFRALLADKKYFDAAEMYAADRPYFDGQNPGFAAELKVLGEGLNAEYEPEIVKEISELEALSRTYDPRPEQWPAIRQALDKATRLINGYDKVEVLRSDAFRSAKANELSAAKKRLENLYEVSAAVALESFDFRGTVNFFDVYPISSESPGTSSILHAVVSRLSNFSSEELLRFSKMYSAALKDADTTQIGNMYVERVFTEGAGRNYGFFEKLDVIRKAREVGFKVSEVKNFSVAYVQLAQDNQTIGAPYPKIETAKDGALRAVSAGEIAADGKLAGSNYLVVVQALPIVVGRKVLEKREQSSRFQAGTQNVPNPQYAVAQSKLMEVQSQYNSQQVQNSYTPAVGAAAGLLRGIADGIMASSVSKARNELNSTSPTVSEPVYQNYQFVVTQVQVARESTYRIWIFDRLSKSFAQQEISSVETKNFHLAHNLRDQDEDIYKHRQDFVDEKVIDAFEKGSDVVQFSWLAKEVVKAAPQFRPLKSEALLLAEAPISNKNKTATAFDARAGSVISDDPRADSVVVIRTLKGSLGSGFFVAPDTVLTNYHVIEGTQLVELSRRNGSRFTGRVFKSDIGLDLALIKVTETGRPVQFSNSTLSTGATVEAIGHPSGLEFTVTRGIISAVRKMRNPLVRGSNEMLVIQTDAAISPGNSGGPLFVGPQVVGINSQKLVKTGVEGIGFAVHYAEVQRFLQEP